MVGSKLVRYFNLFRDSESNRRVRGSATQQTEVNLKSGRSFAHSMPQYIALLAGVYSQPFIQQYSEDGTFEIDLAVGGLLASAVIATLIFPATYRNSWDEQKPIFVQLCTIYGAGIGWQSLVSLAP